MTYSLLSIRELLPLLAKHLAELTEGGARVGILQLRALLGAEVDVRRGGTLGLVSLSLGSLGSLSSFRSHFLKVIGF